MATGLLPLRLLQIGFEASVLSGAVAATKKVIGRAGVTPEIEWDMEDFPRGVRMPTDEITAVRRGSSITVEADLDTEQVLWPLTSGIGAGVITGGAPPYIYTHTLATAPTLRSLTTEFVVDDNAAKHYEREFAACLTSQFVITAERNQMAKLSWTMFGRAEATSTVTGGLAAVARTRIPSNLFTLAIDPTWAGLGVTPKAATMMGFTLTVPTGIMPDYTLDGRADLDFVAQQFQQSVPTLALRTRHNALMATEIGNWRTGTRRFMRLKATSGAGGAERTFQIDLSLRLLSWSFSDEDGQETVESNWQVVYDTVGTQGMQIVVTNGLATLGSL
jgi:hypothetical protein